MPSHAAQLTHLLPTEHRLPPFSGHARHTLVISLCCCINKVCWLDVSCPTLLAPITPTRWSTIFTRRYSSLDNAHHHT